MKIGKLNGGMNMPLYNRLKEYRAKISVNQHEMGKLVGVSRQTISQIERGDYSPSVTPCSRRFLAQTLVDRPYRSMKPLAALWLKVSAAS